MSAAGYAPWWLAGTALAAVTVAHWVLLRRLLGVSGILQRVAFFADARRNAAAEAAAPATAAELEAALLAETLAAFGPEALARAGAAEPRPAADPPRGRSAAAEPPLAACLLFLGAICAGGFFSALLRGTTGLHLGLGADFERIVAAGAAGWGVLIAGGFLVGLGTGLCGGCSSGHGLSGCSRLQRGSLAATASFMGAAIAVSLALRALGGGA